MLKLLAATALLAVAPEPAAESNDRAAAVVPTCPLGTVWVPVVAAADEDDRRVVDEDDSTAAGAGACQPVESQAAAGTQGGQLGVGHAVLGGVQGALVVGAILEMTDKDRAASN